MKYKWLYFLISTFVIGFGLFFIIKWGFYYSIDFVGGTSIEYKIDGNFSSEKIKEILKKSNINFNYFEIKDRKIILKTSNVDQNKIDDLKSNLEKKLKLKLIVLKSETVGPSLSKETIKKTLIAFIFALIGILVYMSFAFRGLNYAISAILAMIHDFLVMIGSYSILSYFFKAEIDTMFVTAVLTTMSFSVHDTIVIFDKIREYLQFEKSNNIEYFANKALTETMVRSINNSMTIIFMLLALFLMGGSTIRFFTLALLIGTITGTYSSPFVATPILVWLEKRKNK